MQDSTPKPERSQTPPNQTANQDRLQSLPNVIQINEGQVQAHLGGLVRQTVEDTLNALLDAEADQLCQAGRYERSPDRVETSTGRYHHFTQFGNTR